MGNLADFIRAPLGFVVKMAREHAEQMQLESEC